MATMSPAIIRGATMAPAPTKTATMTRTTSRLADRFSDTFSDLFGVVVIGAATMRGI